VKPDIEHIRGVNFAVVKFTTAQVTKLPLQHKIRKLGMICSVKPVLTENLCVAQKEDFSITSVFIRDKSIFSSEKLSRKDYYRKSSVEKISGRRSQGA
jgi:hypothetical protein